MDSARLSVRVHPRARRNRLTGVRDGLVGAGVTAGDAGEEANEILVALLSRRLRVDPEQVTIVSGSGSRVKQVRIETLGQAMADARLRGLGADARGRGRRRRMGAAGLVTAGLAAAGIVLVSGSGDSVGQQATQRGPGASPVATHRRSEGVGPASVSSSSARRSARRAAPTAGRHRTTAPSRLGPDPGRLPQTAQLPSAQTQEFAARMRGLWAAIAGAPVATARAAFFPEAAYVQLKSVGDPAADFRYRLYADYSLDIAAAHGLLGAGAGSSRLVRVTVVAGYAHWVTPGVCDNTVGYYELPNARLVYRESRQLRSIGIASLISWRGVWYVVHLGAILRRSAAGLVDAPSAGPGVSADTGTC